MAQVRTTITSGWDYYLKRHSGSRGTRISGLKQLLSGSICVRMVLHLKKFPMDIHLGMNTCVVVHFPHPPAIYMDPSLIGQRWRSSSHRTSRLPAVVPVKFISDEICTGIRSLKPFQGGHASMWWIPCGLDKLEVYRLECLCRNSRAPFQEIYS